MSDELNENGGEGGPEATSEEGGSALSEAYVQPRAKISPVWIIPVVAVLIGAWLVYRALAERGPEITITFPSADGIEAGKTKIKFRDYDMGIVQSVDLADDLSHVTVTARLSRGTEKYLTDLTRFWVVRAQLTAGRITGVETLLSGAYIGMDPVAGGQPMSDFEGLALPPLVTATEPGKSFVLLADEGGSLQIGSPIYHRKVEVGQVVRSRLDIERQKVVVDAFVRAPYDDYIRKSTQFWITSGVDIAIGADGLQVDTESFVSMLIGGIAFDTPALAAGELAGEGEEFHLYPNRRATETRSFAVKHRYIAHFTGSVKGLSRGAPVEFYGMPIGRVVDVRLEYDQGGEGFNVPVLIEIEPERIAAEGEGPDEVGLRLAELVDDGLRAQLKSANLITGQLAVELVHVPDAPPARMIVARGYPEFPTVPTSFEAITATLAQLARRLDEIPLDEIGMDLQASLKALRKTLEETTELASNLNADVSPSLVRTMNAAEETLDDARRLVGPDSAVARELRRSLVKLGDAATSVQQLADHLQENPEDLLRGRD